MKKYLFAHDSDVTRVLEGMGRIINQSGYVTVAEVNDLIGLSSTHQDKKVGWKNTGHVVNPAPNANFSLEFPEPEPITPPERRVAEFQITFTIPNTGLAHEQDVLDAINDSPLRMMATNWSVVKRMDRRPRIQYNSPVRPYGEDFDR